MKLDSEEQRKMILEIMGEFPVQTNLTGLFGGPAPAIRELIQAIQTAEIETEDEEDGDDAASA